MKKYLAGLAVMGAVAFGLSVPANASLIGVGTGTMTGVTGSYQLIYDTDQNITWLDYTKSGDIWSNQESWVSSLSVNVNGKNITGWRLPYTVDGPQNYSTDGSTSYGYNNTTSEMGHLFYIELGNKGRYDTSGTPQAGYGLTQTGPFTNLIASWYWSDTNFADMSFEYWSFETTNGLQSPSHHNSLLLALAVLPGRIESTPVPEPTTILLFGLGLAGLAGQGWRRRGL